MKIETLDETRNQSGRIGAAPSGPTTRALVIEDEEAMCALIKETLRVAGIDDVTLTASADAGDRLQERKFDVILVDLCAPPVNSLKLVRGIRQLGINQKTPIIMISDDLRPAALSESFQAGANFFVYKPIDRAHLMSLIRVTQGTIENAKRRFRRVPVQARIRLKCGDKSVEGETIDLSLNGALVRASHIFPIGSPVEVSLYLHAGRPPVSGLGSIMRVVEGNQMGIQLEGWRAAESGRLQEYLLPLTASEGFTKR